MPSPLLKGLVVSTVPLLKDVLVSTVAPVVGHACIHRPPLLKGVLVSTVPPINRYFAVASRIEAGYYERILLMFAAAIRLQASNRLKLHPSRRVQHPPPSQGSVGTSKEPAETSVAKLHSRPDLLPNDSPRSMTSRPDDEVSGHYMALWSLRDIAIGMRGEGLIPGPGKWDSVVNGGATAVLFLSSCVVQALSHEDGPSLVPCFGVLARI